MISRWMPKEPPPSMRVRQVYGILFDAQCRILVQYDRGRYNLPGGKPENGESWIETLKRECMEESQVSFSDPIYLGYVEVNEDERNASAYAQLRYIAKIASVNPPAVDISTGLIYGRELVPSDEVAAILEWGTHGIQQLKAAIKLAKARYQFGRLSLQRISI